MKRTTLIIYYAHMHTVKLNIILLSNSYKFISLLIILTDFIMLGLMLMALQIANNILLVKVK